MFRMPQPSDPMPDWERRFRAPRVGLPDWARDAPDRCVVVATSGGVLEVHSWDRRAGTLVRATARKEGTSEAAIDPSGQWLWWFADTDGDEFGVWRRQPFGSRPVDAPDVDATALAPGYPAGLAIGHGGLAVVGRTDDDGTEIWAVNSVAGSTVAGSTVAGKLLYRHEQDAFAAALSEDDSLVAIAHSEHGDSRHPALRVLRVADGSTVLDVADGPGLGIEPIAFAPVHGDRRLLVQHERAGRAELLILDVSSGHETPLNLGLDGEVSGADWLTDASGLLVSVDHHARSRLHRVMFSAGGAVASVEAVGPPSGTVLSATARPDGDAWLHWSSSAVPPGIRDLEGNLVLAAAGDPAPPSVPVEDVWVAGPGGAVHALLRRPASSQGALPLVIEVHGGPSAHDEDAFRAYPSAWVDAGFAVAQVNYRGSTGYGSAWRDALEARVGHVELEDVVAVRDYLVAAGIADGSRVVLNGASWGGYLTLLGLGLYPDRWSVGVAGVPVADYVAAYEDEMEALKAFDRSLFGGSPGEVPARYHDSSPLTYVESVRVPVLVLAGENDPRCPIRQIENYLAALTERGATFEVYRYDAGHGSLVDDERVRQTRIELDFVARQLTGPA